MNTYSDKLNDPRWLSLRERVMGRDSYKCRDCDTEDRNETLQVHHCHYESGNPWETREKYLITVCKACHEIRHGWEDEAREALGIIFAKSATPFSQALQVFSRSLVRAALADNGGNMVAISQDDLKERCEERWARYAEQNPKASAREMVEAVTCPRSIGQIIGDVMSRIEVKREAKAA